MGSENDYCQQHPQRTVSTSSNQQPFSSLRKSDRRISRHNRKLIRNSGHVFWSIERCQRLKIVRQSNFDVHWFLCPQDFQSGNGMFD